MAKTALLTNETTTGPGTAETLDGEHTLFIAFGDWGVAGRIAIEVSPDGTNWVEATAFTANGYWQPAYPLAPTVRVRGNVTAGTAIDLSLEMVSS